MSSDEDKPGIYCLSYGLHESRVSVDFIILQLEVFFCLINQGSSKYDHKQCLEQIFWRWHWNIEPEMLNWDKSLICYSN